MQLRTIHCDLGKGLFGVERQTNVPAAILRPRAPVVLYPSPGIFLLHARAVSPSLPGDGHTVRRTCR